MKCPICNQKIINKNSKYVVKGPEIMSLYWESADKVLMHRVCNTGRKRDLKEKIKNIYKIINTKKPKLVDHLNSVKTFPIIELFGHETYHEDAYLVMNEQGRKLLLKTLKNNYRDEIIMVKPYVRDGEGYCLRIFIFPTKKIHLMQEPYLHDWVNKETVPHPADVVYLNKQFINKQLNKKEAK